MIHWRCTDLDLAVATHVAGAAVAVVVVDELYTVLRARAGARVAETLVDVSLAPRSHESGRTLALEPAHLVHTRAVVVTRPWHTVVHVDLTDDPQRTCKQEIKISDNDNSKKKHNLICSCLRAHFSRKHQDRIGSFVIQKN